METGNRPPIRGGQVNKLTAYFEQKAKQHGVDRKDEVTIKMTKKVAGQVRLTHDSKAERLKRGVNKENVVWIKADSQPKSKPANISGGQVNIGQVSGDQRNLLEKMRDGVVKIFTSDAFKALGQALMHPMQTARENREHVQRAQSNRGMMEIASKYSSPDQTNVSQEDISKMERLLSTGDMSLGISELKSLSGENKAAFEQIMKGLSKEMVGQMVKHIAGNPHLSAEEKLTFYRPLGVSVMNDELVHTILHDENGQLRPDAYDLAANQSCKEVFQEQGDAPFRSATLGSKLFSAYVKSEGEEWIKEVVSGVHPAVIQGSDTVDAAFAKPEFAEKKDLVQQTLVTALSSKNGQPLTKDEANAILTQDPLNVPQFVANKLLEGRKKGLANEDHIKGMLGGFKKFMKRAAMQSVYEQAGIEVHNRITQSFKDGGAPDNIIRLVTAMNGAGAANVNGRAVGDDLNDRQRETFRKMGLNQVLLRGISPFLTSPQLLNMPEPWKQGIPKKASKEEMVKLKSRRKAVVQSTQVFQSSANRMDTETRNLRQARLKGEQAFSKRSREVYANV